MRRIHCCSGCSAQAARFLAFSGHSRAGVSGRFQDAEKTIDSFPGIWYLKKVLGNTLGD